MCRLTSFSPLAGIKAEATERRGKPFLDFCQIGFSPLAGIKAEATTVLDASFAYKGFSPLAGIKAEATQKG